MKIYQELKIYLNDDENPRFVKELKKTINSSDWSFTIDPKDNEDDESEFYWIQTTEYDLKGSKIQSSIAIENFLDGYISVMNIFPFKNGKIERHDYGVEEYNFILNKLYTLFLKELSKNHGVKAVLTSDTKLLIESTNGKQAHKALETFVKAADKNANYLESDDFELWSVFVLEVFTKKISISSFDLALWFQQNGWEKDNAWRLSKEFDNSMNLLERFEEINKNP